MMNLWINLSSLSLFLVMGHYSSNSEIICRPGKNLEYLRYVSFYKSENSIIWSHTVSQNEEITDREVSPQSWSSQDIPLATPKGDVTHLYRLQNIDDTWYFIIESVNGTKKYIKGECNGSIFNSSTNN